MRVQTGDSVAIVGFIVTGSDPKRVMVRAIGPSINVKGNPVPGRLADPTLELHDGSGASLTSNDDWKETQQVEIEQSGLAPTDDRESAIIRTLAPGHYTAIVRGKNDATGIGLVEAYDLGQSGNSKLANLSTRGLVETGDNVMIGGFIAGPNNRGSSAIVVRALGPSLTGKGVPGALENPQLELHDQDGAVIASNDDWESDLNADKVESAGLAPNDPHESAIYRSMAPAGYTAIVRGVNDTIGVALVETYNLESR
jgi:hypothetical protein